MDETIENDEEYQERLQMAEHNFEKARNVLRKLENKQMHINQMVREGEKRLNEKYKELISILSGDEDETMEETK